MFEKIDELLKLYLYYELGRPDSSELEFDFHLPSKEWSGSLDQDTLSIYLLDIDENRQLRKNEWQRSYAADEIKSFKPPVMVDLYYLIMAFDKENESRREHELLGDVLKALYRFDSMTKSGYGLTPELEELLGEIKLEIFPKNYLDDRLGLQLWSAIDQNARPLVLLKVTAPIELAVEKRGPPVKSKDIIMEPLNERLYAITGRVVYMESGVTMPVVSAELKLKKGSEVLQTLLSGAKGEFAMLRVPAESLVLEVSAEGYMDLSMSLVDIPEVAKKPLTVEISK